LTVDFIAERVRLVKFFLNFSPCQAALADVMKINYKIFGKIWSNLLAAADVYYIK